MVKHELVLTLVGRVRASIGVILGSGLARANYNG